MPVFNYNPEQYNPNAGRLQRGKYRIRINTAETCRSRTGKDGYRFELAVSGSKKTLKYWLFLDLDNIEKTNQRLGRFFDCFGVEHKTIFEGCEAAWVGLVGAAFIDENDEGYMGIKFLLGKEEQLTLPPSDFPPIEAFSAAPSIPNSAAPNYVPVSADGDLPF